MEHLGPASEDLVELHGLEHLVQVAVGGSVMGFHLVPQSHEASPLRSVVDELDGAHAEFLVRGKNKFIVNFGITLYCFCVSFNF